jgi:hypothetical protein
MNTSQVNGLYPIIRRVRRPLLPVDDQPILQEVQQPGAKPVETSTDVAKQNDSSKAASEVAEDSDSKES